MSEDKIIKFWKIIYIKLFDKYDNEELYKEHIFIDKGGRFECKKLFWRFYLKVN